MGQVYRARDTKLDRDVALKVLSDSFVHDLDRLARFQREAKVLASLNHPNIAHIHGLEESDGVRALVMELVEGEDLAQRLTRGAIPIDEALPIARQIAEALEAAHEQGFIHRDLKPANIKVRADRTVKVLDFGLAKATDGQELSRRDVSNSPTITGPAMTQSGVILGTAAYMSPEQARGQAVDKRSDIWAFGCVFFETLTGRSAFGRATFTDTLAAVVGGRPDWGLLARTPPTITRLIRRCLETNVRRRLHDIADARLELEDALSTTDSSSEGDTVGVRSRLLRRWVPIAAAALTVFAIVALTSAIVFRQRGSSVLQGVPERTIAMQLTNYGGAESGGVLSPDGRSFVFVSNHAGTPDLYLRQVSGGEPVRLTNDPAEESGPAFTADGDTIYFSRVDESGNSIWRIGVLGGQPQKVLDNALTAVPSPDGKHLAYVTTGNPYVGGFSLKVMALDGSGTRTLAEAIRTGTFRPAWSRDGRLLTYSNWPLFGPTDVFVIDVATGQQRRVAQLPPPAATNDGGQPVWLPDNRHLVISYTPLARQQAPADLALLDTQDGSLVRLTMTVGDGLYAPSISSDGSRLLATRLHYMQEVWKIPLGADPDANGQAAVRLIDESIGPLWMFVSRDGRTILFNSAASGSRNLWTVPVDKAGAPRQITSVPGDAISHSSLSPDGTRVAFASIATGHSNIWIQRVDGSGLHQLTNDQSADSWPVWSPDGEWIVYQSIPDTNHPETRRIRAAGGTAEKLFDQGFRGDWIRQPDGNGTWIVTSGASGGPGIRLLDPERHAMVWEWSSPGGGLSLPIFSPDGRSISAPFRESRDHDVVRVFDTATRQSRIAARLPFHVAFRASWVDDGRAIVVNRSDEVSHIVMFDHFGLTRDEK
jgi:serine/threonine protein kinase